MNQIIYLEPKAGFRTPLRSDTFWGMICWGIRSVYGNDALESFLDSYREGNPICQLSSAFPYLESSEGKVRFYPRPVLPLEDLNQQLGEPQQTQQKAMKDRKILKKIKYLEEETFFALLKGEVKPAELRKKLLQQYEDKSLLQPKIDSRSVTHNTIDRIKGGTYKQDEQTPGLLFHQDEYFISEEGGLFVLAKGDITQVKGALRFLSHIGFGADRNTGKGLFDVQIASYDMPDVAEPNAMINLSLYFPKQEEIKQYQGHAFFNYQLEERQGKLSFGGFPLSWKNGMTMFAEGSCFPFHAAPHYGSTEVVLEESKVDFLPYDVYQYGLGFMVPMNLAT